MASEFWTVERRCAMTKTVRALHQSVHAALDERLGAGIDGAGRLVEDHDGRVCHRRAGNGKQLALTLREVCAVGREHGVVAVRQAW